LIDFKQTLNGTMMVLQWDFSGSTVGLQWLYNED